jgi:hypothetical protein
MTLFSLGIKFTYFIRVNHATKTRRINGGLVIIGIAGLRFRIIDIKP